MRGLIGSRIGSLFMAAAVAAAGCAGVEDVGVGGAPLTAQDVDVAPECQGFITYVNTATFAQLDAYLPSNVASNIIARRNVSPYVTLSDLSSVSGVGEYRLVQIHQAARDGNWIGASCVGVFDELLVSSDDEAAIVALVNSISDTELHVVLPNAWNGAVNLLAGRPFTGVAGISTTSGIGPVSLRRIRNSATLSRPLELLAATINALPRDVTVLRHFDWYAALQNQGAYSLNGLVCFGVDPDLLPNGSVIRPNLAEASEVVARVQTDVNFANRYNEFNPAAGIANLQQQVAGHLFFGCYIDYSDNPWSGNNQAFFVDEESGFCVLSERRWAE